MKTLIIIETAEELIAFANHVRCSGDDRPHLPQNATLILNDDLSLIRLEAEGFQLSDKVKAEQVLRLLFTAAGFSARILNIPSI